MTDDINPEIAAEVRARFKRAASRFHQRVNTPYDFTLFIWPYTLLREAGFRNWKGLADLYTNLLSLAWNHGVLIKQGLPKITLHLKPLRESMDVPTRTFQNRLETLEALKLIKRNRINGDRLNGNRTRIIVWAPKFALEFLRENDRNGGEIKIGFPHFGVPDSGSTGTPGHRRTTSDSSDSNKRKKSTKQPGVPDRKKRLGRIAARKKRSDGSDRQRQSKKTTTKYSQAGLIKWYRSQIRKRHGHNPTVNPLALRTRKWSQKKWKLVYEVLATLIPQWDDFLEARPKKMKSTPAYPPLEWINSWWNSFYGWHKAQQDMTVKGSKRKIPTSGRLVLK